MKDNLMRYEPGDQSEDWTKRSAFSPLDRVVATFRPIVTDDLSADARGAIGTRCEWTALWMIEPDDGRPLYTGMRAMQPVPGWVRDAIGWTPECDLEDCFLVTESNPARRE